MDLEQHLKTSDPIPLRTLRRYMRSQALSDRALARHVMDRHWNRIEPVLDGSDARRFLVDYYLQCMVRRDAQDSASSTSGRVHTRFEAARELQGLLEFMNDRDPAPSSDLQFLIERVTDTFLASDKHVRNAIETGFLEHVLERNELVHLFGHWKTHPDLSAAFTEALRWGLAHPRTRELSEQ